MIDGPIRHLTCPDDPLDVTAWGRSYGRGRRGDELDGLVPEHAAEAKANHGLPQFITVIDSCNTVASETHTKYGIWAMLTHL